jgi:small-conductance mechanosensitive channel
VRLGFSGVLLILALAVAGPASAAAPEPAKPDAAAPQPAKVQELMKLLDDPAVRGWLKGQLDQAPQQSTPSAEDTVSAMVDARVAAMRSHVRDLAGEIPQFPAELAQAGQRLSADLAEVGLLRVVALFAVFAALGFGVEALYFRATRPIRQRILHARLETVPERVWVILARFAYGLTVVSAFALGSIGACLIFPWPPLTREIVLAYLLALLGVRIAIVAGRFLLAPQHERFRLIPVGDEAARFWQSRLAWAFGWWCFGYFTIEIMGHLGFSWPARGVVAYTLGLGLLAIGIEAVWRHPATAEEIGQSRQRVLFGRSTGHWLPTLYFILLWVLWTLGAAGLFWLAVVAGAVPFALRLITRIVGHLLRPADSADGVGQPSTVYGALIDRALRAGVLLAAALFLAHKWNIDLVELTGRDTVGVRILRGAINAVVIVIVADMLWSVARVLFDRRIQAGGPPAPPESEEGRRQARLRTLLPIARNFLFAILLVVTGLMVLSALGIDIGPLIAGAGVVGVAIGFGAQTLVKDIISGVFYLLDDAFRVGEYIQSGNYKGTVESFSLRSVKLRHHRGPLYTVPFGQLGAVQNMSRDWVIDKFTLSLTYDTDFDKVKKIVKDIGRELQSDPELGPHIIETLKMQGVEQFGDYAIQIRLKMMTKPGEQFVIRRRALAMLKKAFDANGIKFAFPTVQVSGSGAEAAAAAQQMLEAKAAQTPAP